MNNSYRIAGKWLWYFFR